MRSRSGDPQSAPPTTGAPASEQDAPVTSETTTGPSLLHAYIVADKQDALHEICRVRDVKTADLLRKTIERVVIHIDEQAVRQDERDDAPTAIRLEMAELKARVSQTPAVADNDGLTTDVHTLCTDVNTLLECSASPQGKEQNPVRRRTPSGGTGDK